MKHTLLLLATGLSLSNCAAAPKAKLAPKSASKTVQSSILISKSSPAFIVLPAVSTPPEDTAAAEVRDYLSRITGSNLVVVREDQKSRPAGTPIFIGATKFATRYAPAKPAFADEEWLMQTQGRAIVLTGGAPRGALYGAYRFLEDVCGVNWWNPWEESVPSKPTISVPPLRRRGQPALNYRDIYALYGNDAGRFAARSRLDRQGYAPIDSRYGGSRDYGPPSHAQNFFEYIKPDIYYKEHPDWFLVDETRLLMANGVMTDTVGQLNLGNKAMRQEFLKLLKENIRNSRRAAVEKGLPPYDVYSVSQNDGGTSFVGHEDKELVKREGSDAAAIIDFVNYLADGIREEFPTVFIDTLAYNQSEKAPKTLKARDNVVIRLADTQSNLILPVTDERNRAFRDNVEAWARITRHLRIWDYDITFTNFNANLPTPTMATYAPDLQFFMKNNVQGLFIELEEPVLADMRDLKIWVLSRLMEDPRRSLASLQRQFTDGFYGPAGPAVREYLAALDAAVARTAAKSGSTSEIGWFASLNQFNYLDTPFLQSADSIFEKGSAAVAGDEILSRRLRHARFSLDNAIMMRYPRLIGDWVRSGRSAESFPLNRDVTGQRLLKTWNEQIEIRYPEAERAPLLAIARKQVDALIDSARYVPLPEVFRDIPADRIYVYGFSDSKVYGETTADPDAPSRQVRRLPIAENQTEKFKMPTSWGVYGDLETTTFTQGTIKAEDVPGPGYHWYKLGKVKPTTSSYVFFTWSWNLQFPIGDTVDKRKPDQEVELWACLKFDGPLFPHGNDKAKNSVSLDRMVAIKR